MNYRTDWLPTRTIFVSRIGRSAALFRFLLRLSFGKRRTQMVKLNKNLDSDPLESMSLRVSVCLPTCVRVISAGQPCSRAWAGERPVTESIGSAS